MGEGVRGYEGGGREASNVRRRAVEVPGWRSGSFLLRIETVPTHPHFVLFLFLSIHSEVNGHCWPSCPLLPSPSLSLSLFSLFFFMVLPLPDSILCVGFGLAQNSIGLTELCR